MSLLTDEDAAQVREMLDALTGDVHITYYSQKLQCPSCPQTDLIVGEVGELSERLVVEKLNPLTDTERAGKDDISEVPAIVVSDGTHNRVRFLGAPTGYEFSSFLTAIMDAGTDGPRLEQETLDFLAERLDRDLDIKVFVTPGCPHCPRAVVLAHRMALESDRVRATAIEASEYRDLSMRYMVQGVPRTVVNDVYFVEGALPEPLMVRALERAFRDEEPTAPRNLLDYLEDVQENGE